MTNNGGFMEKVMPLSRRQRVVVLAAAITVVATAALLLNVGAKADADGSDEATADKQGETQTGAAQDDSPVRARARRP